MGRLINSDLEVASSDSRAHRLLFAYLAGLFSSS